MELYNLSVLILGELPSNLTILYGLFTFILGVVAVLILISPIILILKLIKKAKKYGNWYKTFGIFK